MPTKPKRKAKAKPSRSVSDREYDARRNADPVLRAAARIRNSGRWKAFRKWFWRRHPECCNPFGSHGLVVAKQIHHIVPLAVDGSLAFAETNCAPLCTRCHGRIDAMERRGEGAVDLFASWVSEMEGG